MVTKTKEENVHEANIFQGPIVEVQVSHYSSPPASLCSQNSPVVIYTRSYITMPSLGYQHELQSRSSFQQEPYTQTPSQYPLQALCTLITPFLSTGMGSKWQLQFFLTYILCVYDVSARVRTTFGSCFFLSTMTLRDWTQTIRLSQQADNCSSICAFVYKVLCIP